MMTLRDLILKKNKWIHIEQRKAEAVTDFEIGIFADRIFKIKHFRCEKRDLDHLVELVRLGDAKYGKN